MDFIVFCLMVVAAVLALVGSIFAVAGIIAICNVCFKLCVWVALAGLLLFIIRRLI